MMNSFKPSYKDYSEAPACPRSWNGKLKTSYTFLFISMVGIKTVHLMIQASN